jgi:hypothetical protein
MVLINSTTMDKASTKQKIPNDVFMLLKMKKRIAMLTPNIIPIIPNLKGG